MKRIVIRSFWYGFFACLCVYSLFQDLLGLEAYVDMVRTYWSPASRTVPLAAVSLIALLWWRDSLYASRVEKEEEDDEGAVL